MLKTSGECFTWKTSDLRAKRKKQGKNLQKYVRRLDNFSCWQQPVGHWRVVTELQAWWCVPPPAWLHPPAPAPWCSACPNWGRWRSIFWATACSGVPWTKCSLPSGSGIRIPTANMSCGRHSAQGGDPCPRDSCWANRLFLANTAHSMYALEDSVVDPQNQSMTTFPWTSATPGGWWRRNNVMTVNWLQSWTDIHWEGWVSSS